MYKSGEMEIVLARALAKWATANAYKTALPPVWLREMAEQVKGYSRRLHEAGRFEYASFEEDVYKLICCFAVQFLKKVG